MSFDTAVARVLKAEGGYTNDAADSGGPTNWGITQADLSSWRKHPVTADDVRNLGKEEAVSIYKAKYWDAMGCGTFKSDKIALIIFDQGVNRGNKTATMQAQVVCNSYTGSKLTIDGNLGDKSRQVIAGMNEADFCREYLQASTQAYVAIVKRKPSQIVFLTGWINRVQALEDIVWTGTTTIEPAQVPKAAFETPAPVAPSTKEQSVLAFQNPLDWARNELGQQEIVGVKNNPRIVWYHKHCDNIGGEKANNPDEVPWCSSFVNAACWETGCAKTNNALASSWDHYIGQAVKKGQEVEEGDICRLAHPGGHVTFANKKFTWTGQGTFEGLGGNQNNSVKISIYPQNTIVSVHRPIARQGFTLGPVKSHYTPPGTTHYDPAESTV